MEWINVETRNFVKIRLENPTEDKGRLGADVELFNLPGLFFDPVEALRKWRTESNLVEEELPLYRWESRANVTLTVFNTILKDLLFDVESTVPVPAKGKHRKKLQKN